MATIELTPLRYESETAVLTVTARSLAISQWSDRPVVQPLRFQLRVTPSDGDHPLEITGKQADFTALKTVFQDYLQGVLAQGAQPVTESGITLEPEGMTQHRLTLGPLSSTPTVNSLTLSALELADLVDLFEQIDGQVSALPVPLGQSARHRSWRQWSSLAAVFIVSVGTIAVWPYLNRDSTIPTASQSPEVTSDVEAADSLDERSVAAPDGEVASVAQPEASPPDSTTAPPAASPGTTPQQNRPQPKTTTSPEPQRSQAGPSPKPQTPPPVTPPAPAARTRPPEPETVLSPQSDRSESTADANDGFAAESAPASGNVSPLALGNAPSLPHT
ncbi:MAG: DUF4335 domain-containing protein, partial [Cyanobacteria bacterium]|nr:DUF4335 domain-containing protein [Cyanobacteriota bacterium]